LPSRALALLLLLVLAAGLAPAARAGVYLSRAEALTVAFPDADHVERETLILDAQQVAAVESLARARLDSKLVTVYTGRKGDRVLGYAFIDVHTVRTLPEAVLVVLSPEGEVRTLRMLAFYEPGEYLPSDRWLAQFEAEPLSEELRLEGRIHGIAGSTLSARAVTSGVRRALAFHRVLIRKDPAAPEETATAPPAGR
jgi:hypothetical protein